MTTTETTVTYSPDAPGDSPVGPDRSPQVPGEHSPATAGAAAELVASVAAHGVLEPILVTPGGRAARVVPHRGGRAPLAGGPQGRAGQRAGHRADLERRRSGRDPAR